MPIDSNRVPVSGGYLVTPGTISRDRYADGMAESTDDEPN